MKTPNYNLLVDFVRFANEQNKELFQVTNDAFTLTFSKRYYSKTGLNNYRLTILVGQETLCEYKAEFSKESNLEDNKVKEALATQILNMITTSGFSKLRLNYQVHLQQLQLATLYENDKLPEGTGEVV